MRTWQKSFSTSCKLRSAVAAGRSTAEVGGGRQGEGERVGERGACEDLSGFVAVLYRRFLRILGGITRVAM